MTNQKSKIYQHPFPATEIKLPSGGQIRTQSNVTRSSAIAEGPRDESCQLKSCQLPRNNAVQQVLNKNRSYEVGGLRWADV